MSQLTLTDNDNGKTVDVQVGDTITVCIAENPTTGYCWDNEQLDNPLLELQSSDYKSTSEGLMGGGGERSFTFRVVQAGKTEIKLKLWRVWLGDKSIAKRYSVTLQING